jgi:hypothetical protein
MAEQGGAGRSGKSSARHRNLIPRGERSTSQYGKKGMKNKGDTRLVSSRLLRTARFFLLAENVANGFLLKRGDMRRAAAGGRGAGAGGIGG